MDKNTKCCCKTIRSITHLDIQYAHRFYGFKGEAQYLHGHTGGLTLEVEDAVNPGVNMVFPCNEIKKTAPAGASLAATHLPAIKANIEKILGDLQ